MSMHPYDKNRLSQERIVEIRHIVMAAGKAFLRDVKDRSNGKEIMDAWAEIPATPEETAALSRLYALDHQDIHSAGCLVGGHPFSLPVFLEMEMQIISSFRRSLERPYVACSALSMLKGNPVLLKVLETGDADIYYEEPSGEVANGDEEWLKQVIAHQEALAELRRQIGE